VIIYNHTLIDDSSAQGGDKEICSVEEDNSTMCNGIVIGMESILSQVEIHLHEDMELQSELQHALDVVSVEHENVEMPSQSNVKSIMACVEVGDSRVF
jgi:hypothetical protein